MHSATLIKERRSRWACAQKTQPNDSLISVPIAEHPLTNGASNFMMISGMGNGVGDIDQTFFGLVPHKTYRSPLSIIDSL